MGAPVWAALGVVLVVNSVRRRRCRKDLHKLPRAPGCLPFVGNIGLVKTYGDHALHRAYERFADSAGEGGLLRLSVLGTNRVITTTPQAFADVLRKAGFLRKPLASYHVFYMFGFKANSLFMQQDCEEHTRVRRAMMKFFCADNVALTIRGLSAEARRTVTKIAAAEGGSVAGPEFARKPDDRRICIDSDGNLEDGIFFDDGQGALVNAFQIASTNILSIVFQVFLEVDIMPPMHVIGDTFAHANAVAAHPLQYHLLRRGLYPGYRLYRRNFDALYKFHRELMRRVYAKPLPEGSSKFWAAVRYAYPDALTDLAQYELALANLMLIYVAGYETTANAISHTLAALALDQDCQTALAEELSSLGLLATAEAPAPRALTAEDLAQMPFLDAVVHESLRLMSPAPNGGFRKLETDMTVCGRVLPKDTEVMMPVWSLHYNKRVWGADAACWRPDRWLEGGSVAAARKDADGNLRFMPFLDGPSNCIGQHLAVSEIKMVVATMLSWLHITMDPQRMAHMRTVDDYAAAAVTKITLQQSGATWLRMRQRAPRSTHAESGGA